MAKGQKRTSKEVRKPKDAELKVKKQGGPKYLRASEGLQIGKPAGGKR